MSESSKVTNKSTTSVSRLISRSGSLSIQHKLALLMVGISIIVGFLISAVFIVNDYYVSRKQLVYETGILARVSAQNSTAALSFNDKFC